MGGALKKDKYGSDRFALETALVGGEVGAVGALTIIDGYVKISQQKKQL